jgi:hypothetical protein
MNRLALGTVIGCILFAACGGGSSKSATLATTTLTSTATKSAPTTTNAKTDYVALYRSITDPTNVAGNKFLCDVKQLPESATGKDLASLADPLADKVQDASGRLLDVKWPADTKSDVRKLVTDIAAVIGDLRNARTVTGFNARDWAADLNSDLATLGASANFVRTDIGLPAKRADPPLKC